MFFSDREFCLYFFVSLDLQILLSEEKDHDLIVYLFVIGRFF